jgi:hypothetical protein
LEITYDTAAEPVLAIGRGAAYLEEASRWVVAYGQPMIYEQSDGQFVFVHGPAGGIEEWWGVTSQAKAAARARGILAGEQQASA